MGYLEVLRTLDKASWVLVITHKNADLDALASSVLVSSLLKSMGKEFCIGLPEGLSRLSKNALETLGLGLDTCNRIASASVSIVVDASNGVVIGDYYAAYRGSEARILIDHHEPGELASLATAMILDPGAASTSELVVELLAAAGARPDPREATLGLAGIVYDSKRYAHAVPGTFRATLKLLEWGADYHRSLSLAYPSGDSPKGEILDFSERMAVVKAASRMKVARACNLIVATSYIGSFESSAARSLLRIGADVAVIVVPRDDHARVSVRVSKRALDRGIEASWVADYVAKRMGGQGGGHRAAAMAHVPPGNPEDIVEDIARSLPGKIARRCTNHGEGGVEDENKDLR
ncbi:MAG: DHH family phosphoesterase [Desulfurococcales archaeon]|nr:DHH family phosphoesterase [Desulfurococcales archaeon]